MVTVELPKGELMVEVGFQNSTLLNSVRAVKAEEWFVTARDPLTSKELWNGRFSYWEWRDVFGDDSKELSDEEWFEGMGDQLIALLDAMLTSSVRLAEFEKKPLFRIPGWRWHRGIRTQLQLLIDGEWHVWDKTPGPLLWDRRRQLPMTGRSPGPVFGMTPERSGRPEPPRTSSRELGCGDRAAKRGRASGGEEHRPGREPNREPERTVDLLGK
jgi:hypothetical protein